MPAAARRRATESRGVARTRDGDVFRAVADPTRRAILDRLRTAPASVHSIAMDFAISRPAVSKHLRVLLDAGLVTEERDGRERIYALQAPALREVASWVDGYRRFWLDGLNNLKRMLENEEKGSR
jgi:DNA-binding transcriptional ArsR family regulator